MQKWRLLDCGRADAYTNMARDEALLLVQAQDKDAHPTLRFYCWKPAAISLGYAQKIEEAVDLSACKKAGIDIVRRNTGGRAVFHNYELTYSLVVKADNPLFSSNIRESYATIGRGLLAGLQKLGINAQLSKRNFAGINKSSLCYLAPSWYEIVVGGKKLVGSAQRRVKGIILQHGSIPLRVEDSFFDFWQLSPNQRNQLKTQWKQKTVSLYDLIGQRSVTQIKQALIEGFEQTLPIKLTHDKFTKKENTIAAQLLTKYKSAGWNEQGKQPAYNALQ